MMSARNSGKGNNNNNNTRGSGNNNNNNNSTSMINNSWQPHSNERCLACQQLLSICSCSHNQQKQLRQRIADLTDKEARNRHNIERAFNNSRSQYTASLEFTIDLCDIEDSETRNRSNLIRSVNKSFNALNHKFFFGFHFCDLETEERRRRSVIARNEVHEHFFNVRDFDANFNIARLLNSEQLARQSIEEAEFETSHQLYTINERLHHRAIAFVQSCEELERQFFAVLDEIEEECSTSYRVLDQAFTQNHQLVIIHHKERVALMEQAFAGLRRFEPLEEIRRSEIRRDFTEELFEVEQLVHMHAEERKQFMVLESRARDNIRAVGNSRFHSLLDRCEEEREGIKIEAERRVEDQLAVIRDALFELHQITNEEEESRKEILETQDTEKDATRQWILEKQIARNRLLQELRRTRNAIWNEYQTDFDFIRQQRDDRETSIQLNAEILENEIDDFVSREAEYRSQIEDGRNADIRHVSLMMEDQLINVRRKIQSRRSRISDLFHFEESSRQETLSLEANARQFIFEDEFERVGEEILDREEKFESLCSELLKDAEAAGQIIEIEEETELDNIDRKYTAECDEIKTEILQFSLDECMDYETAYRQNGIDGEREERKEIVEFCQSIIRQQAHKEEMELDMLLMQLAADEDEEREYIACEALEESSELLAWHYKVEAKVRVYVEARLEQEQMQKERFENYLMYGDGHNNDDDDDDDDGGENNHYYDDNNQRQSTMMNRNNNNHHRNTADITATRSNTRCNISNSTSILRPSVSQNHPFQPQAIDLGGRLSLQAVRRSISLTATNDREVKIAYLNRMARRTDCDRLNDQQLNAFVELLENSADKRHTAEANNSESEDRLRVVERDLNCAETKALSKTEAVDFYKRKHAEEAKRNEMALERAAELTRKEKKQMNVEEERLKNAKEHQRELLEEIEVCKDQIHNKLSGRNAGGGNNVATASSRTASSNSNNNNRKGGGSKNTNNKQQQHQHHSSSGRLRY